MQTWSITLHGPAGIISTVDTAESQFVIGTETASDVFTVQGDGIAPRHVWVWINEAGLQAEDLGGGTLVNGYQITERVQVEYPASVQVGEVTLVIELKAVQPEVLSPTPSSMDITIPQRAVTKSKASLEVTIPQRTPTRGNVQKGASSGTAPAQSEFTDKASTLCEYTLVREIARGGMGQIYFGEDPQLERQVAVKVSSISEEGEDPRFSKEAKVLARLAHPNIVPIYNIGIDAQSRPFYSMKLIKGRTLQAVLNLIRDGDALAIKEYSRATLLTIFRKVCDAMMFAHSKGILHRDLKPENIMVGEYGEVLVMDWGLAKVLGEREEKASVSRVNDTGDYGMTMEGEVMGTPQYMSPEQAQGVVAELDQRSDIYSLGGILYAILTLRPPIDGTTLDEVLTKVKNGSISSMVTKRGGKASVTVGAPSAMGAEVPEALQAVTLKAMATDRNKRYGSVEAFAGDIERYQNGFATAAENAGALRRLVLFVKRNKGISAAALLFFLGVVFFVLRLEAEKEQAQASEQHALAANETSRKEAAKARIALAEAAELAADSEGIRSALSGVPEDLRNADWRYFDARSDSADLKIPIPAKADWLMVDHCPDAPDWIVALQNDGQLSVVHTVTGEITPLWKAARNGFTIQGADVSADGKWVTLVWKKGNLFEFEVRSLREGSLIGAEIAASWNIPAGIEYKTRPITRTSDTWLLVHRWSSQEGWVLEAWELQTGKKKWERFKLQSFELGEDEKSVQTINEKNKLETIELASGATISTTVSTFPGNDLNRPSRTCFRPKSKTFLGDRGNAVVRLDTSNEKLLWEARYETGRIAAIVPGQAAPGLLGKGVAVLYNKNNSCCLLEIRDASNGKIIRSHPFVGRLPFSGVIKIAASRQGFAVAISKRILVWRNDIPQPKSSLATNSGNSTTHLLSQENRLICNTLSKERDANTLLLVDPTKNDMAKGTIFSREVHGFITGKHAAISADRSGTRVAIFDSGSLGMYRIADDKILETEAPRKVPDVGGRFLAFHPDGKFLLVGNKVLSFPGGLTVSRLKSEPMEFFVLSGGFSCSGVWVGESSLVTAMLERVANESGEEEQRILVRWNAESGESDVRGLAPQIACICASADGRWIAEGGRDKKVRIRNGSTLETEQEFRAHEAGLCGIAWHPKLPVLATCSRDGVVRIWDTQSWKMLEEILVGSGERGLKIHENGKTLAVIEGARLDLYEPKTFQK